ncbi:MAG TPA: VOC family protein [Chitinophagaceae bacterium]|nr:VOC family protein [Chitinophagaceae bacterium]
MKLHHIGYVVKDIEQYEKNLLFEKKVRELFDPVQNSKMALYSNFNDSFIELIQPLNEESFTYNFLQKSGGGYHHLCYEMNSAGELMELASAQKLIRIKGPLPAILFDNREVWFYFTRNKQIVEFVI